MKNNKKITIKCPDLTSSDKLAHSISKLFKGGEIICFIGNLGSGKTTFIKYLCSHLGVDINDVISPTFIYQRVYKGKDYKINHFDFYRFDEDKIIETTGLYDAFEEKDSIILIEWADKIEEFLPKDRIIVNIDIEKNTRIFKFSTKGDKYNYFISEFAKP